MLALRPALVLYKCLAKVWGTFLSVSPPLPSPAERKLGDMATAVGGVQNEILELEGQEAVLLQQLSHLRERLDTVRAKKVGSCDACEGLEGPAAPQMLRLWVVMLVL